MDRAAEIWQPFIFSQFLYRFLIDFIIKNKYNRQYMDIKEKRGSFHGKDL